MNVTWETIKEEVGVSKHRRFGTMKIDIPWKCPMCGGSLKPTSTHLRSGDKPDIYQRACTSCDFAMCWFEMKDGYVYTLDYKKYES